MRAIFYAPMAHPDAGAASGVPRMGVLLQRALKSAGVEVMTPKLPRTYDGRGEAQVQIAHRQASDAAAGDLLGRIRGGQIAKPDFWFSYHVYYKSPDWIGPAVARELRIPYLAAECSHAPKRAGGPWALGHEGTTLALSAADRLLAMTAFDRVCLDRLAPGRVRDLKPFIDTSVFGDSASRDNAVPHLVAVGMMRNERKRASYAMLASALRLLEDVALKLTIAGDGVFRREVEAMFSDCPSPLEGEGGSTTSECEVGETDEGAAVRGTGPSSVSLPRATFSLKGRRAKANHEILFLGEVASEGIPALLSSADIFAWPGIGEAYGLVFLEAQAAGLPVVACRDRGVPDVTRDGETALLCAPQDVSAFAANLRRVLTDRALRQRLGAAGRAFVHGERSIAVASATLRSVLAELDLP